MALCRGNPGKSRNQRNDTESPRTPTGTVPPNPRRRGGNATSPPNRLRTPRRKCVREPKSRETARQSAHYVGCNHSP
eukprot:272388-Heterocapsa_arctica.AAC.1